MWVNRDAWQPCWRIQAELGCVCADRQQSTLVLTPRLSPISAVSAWLRQSGSKRSVVVARVAEQSELRRIARGLGQAEMAEGVRGQQPAAWRALQIAALDQIWLDDVLDRVARLGQRRRHGFNADRAAAVIHRDGGEIAPVHRIEAGGVDFQ